MRALAVGLLLATLPHSTTGRRKAKKAAKRPQQATVKNSMKILVTKVAKKVAATLPMILTVLLKQVKKVAKRRQILMARIFMRILTTYSRVTTYIQLLCIYSTTTYYIITL